MILVHVIGRLWAWLLGWPEPLPHYLERRRRDRRQVDVWPPRRRRPGKLLPRLGIGLAVANVAWLSGVTLAIEAGWWNGPLYFSVSASGLGLLLLVAWLLRGRG